MDDNDGIGHHIVDEDDEICVHDKGLRERVVYCYCDKNYPQLTTIQPFSNLIFGLRWYDKESGMYLSSILGC